MRYSLGFLFIALLLIGCGGNPQNTEHTEGQSHNPSAIPLDDGKGVGEIKQVTLNDPLEPAMIIKGKGIYELKCAACHKLTDQRVVGPGFAGITQRRKPEWIMNMILNTDAMLSEDPTARALFEECLTRMPNQNLSEEDARAVLEFLYANDNR